MDSKISLNDFKYVLIPGSMPDEKYVDLHQKAYQCWRDVWLATFQELGVNKPLPSDSFTRQDYVGCIFYKDKCVALSFFRWVDSRTLEFDQDTYFSNWDKPHLDKLCSRGSRIIVCSQFTVHPEARGTKLGVSGKDLLMGMIVETFMNSKADGMTGAVRVNRGVNDAGERWGAYVIERKVPCEFGEKNTDLIGFFKDYISRQRRPDLVSITHALWEDRLLVRRQRIEDDFVIQFRARKRAA